MKIRKLQSGFSLTEVLMAVGILMVGMMIVAGTFPVGIHLTAVSTEQTIAAVVADEAFAKIQLYGVTWLADSTVIDVNEYLYPSDSSANQIYNWSAIRQRLDVSDPCQVQVTVFVNRKVSAGLKYFEQDASFAPEDPATDVNDWPKPVRLDISAITNKEIEIDSGSYANNTGFSDYITDDSMIVDNETGDIYKVVEVDVPNDIFYINRDWQGLAHSSFWVVPPPVSGGKSPCIGVYQKVIEF